MFGSFAFLRTNLCQVLHYYVRIYVAGSIFMDEFMREPVAVYRTALGQDQQRELVFKHLQRSLLPLPPPLVLIIQIPVLDDGRTILFKQAGPGYEA